MNEKDVVPFPGKPAELVELERAREKQRSEESALRELARAIFIQRVQRLSDDAWLGAFKDAADFAYAAARTFLAHTP